MNGGRGARGFKRPEPRSKGTVRSRQEAPAFSLHGGHHHRLPHKGRLVRGEGRRRTGPQLARDRYQQYHPNRPYLIPSLQTLNAMDQRVESSSWAVVGGLMVHLHCAEAGIRASRTTEDIDLAIDVFADRTALYRLTVVLRDLGFQDVTPDPLTGGHPVVVPVAARRGESRSHGAEEDRDATQSGPYHHRSTVGGTACRSAGSDAKRPCCGHGRRAVRIGKAPNILGAVVIKAVASTQDRRDPDRHREDLAMLGAVAAGRADLARLAIHVSPKDRKRLRAALDSMPERFWLVVPEPAEAKSALMPTGWKGTLTFSGDNLSVCL